MFFFYLYLFVKKIQVEKNSTELVQCSGRVLLRVNISLSQLFSDNRIKSKALYQNHLINIEFIAPLVVDLGL